ncbi:MAG: hypothetical protein Q8P62_04340 [Candidatus Peregrinibacteria bacterium]|nr:hypothetical protein [Candidatus Peregrinibacteria bacterium]
MSMALDARKSGVENAGEGVDFAKNVLVVGTLHYLNEQERQRIEVHVRDADFVCIEWDQIRDNEAKGRNGGYRDHFHTAYFGKTRVEGDHLYANLGDMFLYDRVKSALGDRQNEEARKNGGSGSFKTAEGNEFLYIQELCAKYGKPCYFVDRLISHTRQRIMSSFKDKGFVESFSNETRDRSRYMEAEVQRISGERLAETGKQEQCALFVGNTHLEDFSDRRFRKAKAPVRTSEVDVNQMDED